MSDFAFNISKGRGVEFYWRVKNNDPSTSALVLIVLAPGGLEDKDTLVVKETFADVVAGTTNEVTGTGWDRKILTDADLASFPAPNHALNRYEVVYPTVSWTPVAAADDHAAAVICYDANTGTGTDADLIPISFSDFEGPTEGNQVVLNQGIFFQAEDAV